MANAVLGFLKKAAPFIATAVGTAAPGPLGIVASVISQKLNTEHSSDSKAITGTLSTMMQTDDGRAKIADIEAGVQKAFNDLKIKEVDEIITLAQGEVADRASARNLQALTKSLIVPILAGFVVSAYVTILVLLMLGYLHVTNNEALMILLGGLQTAFICVISFYFGSSMQSHAQTDAMSQKGTK